MYICIYILTKIYRFWTISTKIKCLRKNSNQIHGISKFNKMILIKAFMCELFCVCLCVCFEIAVNELDFPGNLLISSVARCITSCLEIILYVWLRTFKKKFHETLFTKASNSPNNKREWLAVSLALSKHNNEDNETASNSNLRFGEFDVLVNNISWILECLFLCKSPISLILLHQ